ncbi:regulatory LuxR family protein [Kribbella sp. VKM Ac-2527]|uniref:Regulatory LuxR family protein n=1 Tax=Kribbella caucasensis TaxID=2512215 RepID=A0A4R6KEY3_9ACTN|nr:LuxR family transcriptional regulator [Kribbella sp. VKM Ac-2527]TDO46646.1 regulatory LuxR family protein [Kribbella sp. VKM Ac-2527]
MTSSVLIGRDAVLADLSAVVIRSGEHGPSSVLLTGPRWIGLTSVVAHFAGEYDGPVRRARAVPWEAGAPGAVLAQLLPGELPGDDPIATAAAVVQGVGGGQPTLFVVDDAHHADPFSLQVLSSAVRRHREACFVVVLTAPTTEPATDSATAELLVREPDRRIVLDPLTPTDIAQLAGLRGISLPTWLAGRLHLHTRGLPGAVAALLDELPRTAWSDTELVLPAPTVVAARVARSLGELTAAGRRVAETVAVLESPRPIDLVAGLADADDPWAAVEEAERVGLVALSGPPGARLLAPADPMVAAATRAEIGSNRTAELHRRAAAAVADDAARLRHLVAAAAAPDAALADELASLAEVRSAQGAWAEAASLLTESSRLTEDRLRREARLTRAVDALVGAGDGPGATALIPEIESLRETPLRNAVLGYLAILRGRGAEAEARLSRAWELANAERTPDVAALVAQRYVLHSLARCHWQELVRWADRALALVDLEDPAGIEAAAIRGLGLVACGEPAAARTTYAELTERVRQGAQVQRVTLGSGWLHLALDEVETARAELESAVPTSVRGGSARISLWARAWLSRTQFLIGEWDRSLETSAAAEPLLQQSEIVLAGPIMAWTTVQIHALRGEWDLARAALLRAERWPRDYELMRIPIHLAHAVLAEAQADDHGVIRALQPLTAPALREAAAEPSLLPWIDLYATALILLGRHEEADILLTEHEKRAAAEHHRSAIARLARARGRLQAAVGDQAGAWSSFDTALSALAGLPLRFDRARVEFAYGQALRRAGKRREATALLSSARDVFVALRAEVYVARCDRELKAGGLDRADRGDEQLTAQEQAVTELVARGLSNREVAAQLFLSTKTVQYHLTRIYAKLGIRSRAELAALRGRQ